MNTEKLKKNRQQGAAGGYIIAILLFGGLMTMGSKLAPLYMDHNTMSTIMDKMAEETGLGAKTDSQLIEMMKKRLKLNNIRDFPIQDHVEFKRSGRGTDVIMDYEVRLPMVHNLDLIASFNKEIELRD
ncbi:MAG: DUF4845 domain-containing protein [Gammaproteobacteria bacterium]|nr:DUF4845 domain-containing protein [Gammaproteobacteria bacterium]MBT4493982.1 DUF4845 domain-containing protein [Gammaproteobacteria bacterium]MBT7370328.1 DUF4845 domain-containing protein [Gammaproteobacteria bacterium]